MPPVSSPPATEGGCSQSSGGPGGAAQPSRDRILVEALVVFGIATAICAVLWHLRRIVPFIDANLHGLIAAVFLLLPTEVLVRRQASFSAHGLTVRPIGKGLLYFAMASAVVFPLFSLGFYAYYRGVCGLAALPAGPPLPRPIRQICRRFVGSWRAARLVTPPDLAQVVLAQVLVVGLPEEYFFRGYLQSRLEIVWPSRRRLLGAPVGLSLIVASILFALGHVLVDLNGLRLAVFFPSLLFGWMRQATGSILAGVLFHASSNLVSELLHAAFLR